MERLAKDDAQAQPTALEGTGRLTELSSTWPMHPALKPLGSRHGQGAMDRLRPVTRVMTWNFALLAMDQIVNSAAKVRQMSGGQLTAPVVPRAGGEALGQRLGEAEQARCSSRPPPPSPD